MLVLQSFISWLGHVVALSDNLDFRSLYHDGTYYTGVLDSGFASASSEKEHSDLFVLEEPILSRSHHALFS